MTSKTGLNDAKCVVQALGEFLFRIFRIFRYLQPFFIEYLGSKLHNTRQRVRWKVMKSRTGLNDAKHVVQALGELFFLFFVFFNTYYCFIDCRLHNTLQRVRWKVTTSKTAQVSFFSFFSHFSILTTVLLSMQVVIYIIQDYFVFRL